jgi:hypothetical protein
MLELIYMSPLRAMQKTKLPLALKLWYNPSGQIGHVALLFIAQPHRCRRPRPPDACPAIPPRVHRHRSFSARPDPVSARWASGLGFVAQPSNPTVFWWTAANPTCRLRSWAATLHRLQSTTSSCFSCHHAARTWPSWPPGPSSQAYLSLHSSEAPQGIDLSRPLFTCTTQIMPQPAPVILGKESVHTTLSITHHSQERPSIGPRTLRSSEIKLMKSNRPAKINSPYVPPLVGPTCHTHVWGW